MDLQKSNPFFSYITMHLDLKEVKDDKQIPTMGVDMYGNLYFNPDFVNKLNQSEITGVICHETLHVVFEHLSRIGSRIPFLWNIATDIVINDIIITNNFALPKDIMIPSNHKITLDNITITDTDKKIADEVYNELYRKAKKIKCVCGHCKTDGEAKEGESYGTCKGFDKHIYSKKEGKGSGKGENKEKDAENGVKEGKDWQKVLTEAAEYARQRGNAPAGLDRWIKEILYPKMPWREILYKYITRELPYNYTYSMPSKKSIASGIYMPSVEKEGIEVIVSVDTSGSISEKELNDFMSEVVGIAKSFSGIRMTVLVCDADIQDVLEVTNGNIDTLLELKPKGGGGTSHVPVYKWIQENKPNSKILVALTDAYTEFPKEESTKTLWVLCQGHADIKSIPFGEVVEI